MSILLFVTTLWGEGDFLLSRVGFPEGRELLPGCCQVELAVLLGKLNRLLDNSLQLVVITNLGIEIRDFLVNVVLEISTPCTILFYPQSTATVFRGDSKLLKIQTMNPDNESA